MEPEAFIKAWNGALRFTTVQNSRLKLYIILGTSTEGAYLQEVLRIKSSLRKYNAFVLVDATSKRFCVYHTADTNELYIKIAANTIEQFKSQNYTGLFSITNTF